MWSRDMLERMIRLACVWPAMRHERRVPGQWEGSLPRDDMCILGSLHGKDTEALRG